MPNAHSRPGGTTVDDERSVGGNIYHGRLERFAGNLSDANRTSPPPQISAAHPRHALRWSGQELGATVQKRFAQTKGTDLRPAAERLVNTG